MASGWSAAARMAASLTKMNHDAHLWEAVGGMRGCGTWKEEQPGRLLDLALTFAGVAPGAGPPMSWLSFAGSWSRCGVFSLIYLR